MPLSLKIGTIDIDDQNTVRYLKGKSMEEIKAMLVSFLTSRSQADSVEEALDDRLKGLRIVDPDKARRVEEALDSLNRKLSDLKDVDIQNERDRYMQEKFHA